MTSERHVRQVKQGIRDGLEQIGQVIVQAAKENVHENRRMDRPLPSRLAESIDYSATDELALTIEATAAYAVMVEFGTYKKKAEPFLQPAYEAIRPDIKALIHRLIVESVKA